MLFLFGLFVCLDVFNVLLQHITFVFGFLFVVVCFLSFSGLAPGKEYVFLVLMKLF